VSEAANKFRGKWRSILIALGVDEKFLRNIHGPCPICQGKDRFRFDDKNGEGTWFCNQCGAGDGFTLLMHHLMTDFKTVLKRVEEVAGQSSAEPFKDELSEAAKRRILNTVWKAAQRPDIAVDYLRSRGLKIDSEDELPVTVRGSDCLYDATTNARYHGVVSLIQSPTGHPVSLHRIYIGNGRRWKKVMPPVTTIAGGAIRLGDPEEGGCLCVAEGVESGFAARAMRNQPTWCGISANMMAQMSLPKELRVLNIYADCDESFTGQAAAYQLANSYWNVNRDCNIRVFLPTVQGHDPLDVFNESDCSDTQDKNFHVDMRAYF